MKMLLNGCVQGDRGLKRKIEKPAPQEMDLSSFGCLGGFSSRAIGCPPP